MTNPSHLRPETPASELLNTDTNNAPQTSLHILIAYFVSTSSLAITYTVYTKAQNLSKTLPILLVFWIAPLVIGLITLIQNLNALVKDPRQLVDKVITAAVKRVVEDNNIKPLVKITNTIADICNTEEYNSSPASLLFIAEIMLKTIPSSLLEDAIQEIKRAIPFKGTAIDIKKMFTFSGKSGMDENKPAVSNEAMKGIRLTRAYVQSRLQVLLDETSSIYSNLNERDRDYRHARSLCGTILKEVKELLETDEIKNNTDVTVIPISNKLLNVAVNVLRLNIFFIGRLHLLSKDELLSTPDPHISSSVSPADEVSPLGSIITQPQLRDQHPSSSNSVV